MECELLINNGSRSAKQKAAEVEDALIHAGFVILKIHAITRRHPLDESLQAIRKRRLGLLVVCGGDGTVSTVLNRLAGEPIEIGIIPLGTTNNFARSLDLPLTINESVDIIKRCKGHLVDLGVMNGTFFTNVAGIGISADIARHVSDVTKRRWGRLAYGLVGAKRIWAHRPFVVTVEDVRHNLTVTFETHQVIIANGRYHAGREIASDAAIDNGQMLVFALGGPSKLSLLKHMIDFYFGGRRRVAHSSYVAGRNIKITTNEPRQIEIDGEVKMKTPVTAVVEKAAVRVRFRR